MQPALLLGALCAHIKASKKVCIFCLFTKLMLKLLTWEGVENTMGISGPLNETFEEAHPGLGWFQAISFLAISFHTIS